MTTRDGINGSLKIIGLKGLDGLSVKAPNALRGLGILLKSSPARTADPSRILAELKRQGLVDISANAGNIKYTLTPAGAHRLQKISIDELKITTPKKWDKKWRVVTFDVPVSQSSQRVAFVERLQAFDFMMLQKSVWVHPAPCFAQVEQAAAYYNVLRWCTLMEVSRLDDLSARKLLRHFDL